jgi:DNA-binding response OmpR family regulator
MLLQETMLPKRILIIGNASDAAEAFRVSLDLQDFECLVALDGRQGMELVRKEIADLIIIDGTHPDMQAFNICRLLKFDLKYSRIPIIVFTSKGCYQDRNTAKEVGADYSLTKPFDREILVSTVMHFLSD